MQTTLLTLVTKTFCKLCLLLICNFKINSIIVCTITISRGLERDKRIDRNVINKTQTGNEVIVAVIQFFFNTAAGSHEVEMKEQNVQTEESVEKQGM